MLTKSMIYRFTFTYCKENAYWVLGWNNTFHIFSDKVVNLNSPKDISFTWFTSLDFQCSSEEDEFGFPVWIVLSKRETCGVSGFKPTSVNPSKTPSRLEYFYLKLFVFLPANEGSTLWWPATESTPFTPTPIDHYRENREKTVLKKAQGWKRSTTNDLG